MNKLHELRQQRKALADEMRKLHHDIGDAVWSDEQRSKWDGMKSDLSNFDDRITREEELRSVDQSFVEDNDEQHREHRNGGQEQSAEQRQSIAFDAFLREGFSDMDDELRSVIMEMRAQGTDPATKGGYTVPTKFQAKVVEAMKDYGGLANIAFIMNTSDGAELDWATSDGTAEEGELLGENAAATDGDVTFGGVSLGAKTLSSKIIRVSNQLLQDSGIPIDDFLIRRLAMRIGRGEAKYLVTGTGSGTPAQPKGLAASVGTPVTSAAAAVKWQDFNALKHSVDPAYRNSGCRWLFNDNTLKQISEMVDDKNRPLWLPGISAGVPATFLDFAYQVDQAVPDLAAGAKGAYFGDFQRFIVRRVRGMAIKRLVERYAEYNQTGFIGFHRFDCLLEDMQAIKALTLKG